VTITSFYDDLTPWYHVIYHDWDMSMARQGDALHQLIVSEWGPAPKTILDVAAGIGTQALPLAQRGHRVIGGDLSLKALARARVEADRRGVALDLFAADMSSVPIRDATADVVMACDNAIPHLLDDDAIRAALRDFYRCVRPGGGCVVTMRDYGTPPPAGTRQRKPYGTRSVDGRTYEVRQTWTWNGPHYNLLFEIVDETTGKVVLATETKYFAIAVFRVLELMVEVGFTNVRRVDEGFYQPIGVGTRPLGG
jgi:ubiquinone/menaquinone biosynthesis C-methylase UbiE